MKKLFSFFCGIFLLLTGCSSEGKQTKDIADQAFEMSIDLTGINKNKKAEEENGKRIIMDSVALTQLAEHLDLKLTGIPSSNLGKTPERYKDIYQIGMPMNPNMEVVKSLNPTMVYVPDSLVDWVDEGFKKHRIPYKYVNLRSVENLYYVAKELATEYNKLDSYNKLEDKREKFFNSYNKKIVDKKKPKVLILMGLPGSYVAATENSYVGNLVRLAGGQNIVQSTKEFENINMEYLLSQQPDVILRAAHAMPDVVNKMFQTEFESNKSWQHFSAVKNNKVYDLDFKIFAMTAQFDYDEGLEQLYKIFYE